MIRKANPAERKLVLSWLSLYLKKFYPHLSAPLHSSVYADYQCFVDEIGGRKQGGVLLRIEGQSADVHVICPEDAFTDEQRIRSFLAFTQYQTDINSLKEWTTSVRCDRHDVRDALRQIGFREHGGIAQFVNYIKEV